MLNFVTLWQEVSGYVLSKICAPEKWTKVHQNRRRLATHKCPPPCQISLHSIKRCTRKALQNFFLHPSLFWCRRKLPGPKFTNLGPDVQQAPSINRPNFVLFWQLVRYLLPNLVNFVDGITDTHTQNSKRHVSAIRIPCGDYKWILFVGSLMPIISKVLFQNKCRKKTG